jgi:hypothetical protein
VSGGTGIKNAVPAVTADWICARVVIRTLPEVSGWTLAMLNTAPLEDKKLTGRYAHEVCVEAAERARAAAPAEARPAATVPSCPPSCPQPPETLDLQAASSPVPPT